MRAKTLITTVVIFLVFCGGASLCLDYFVDGRIDLFKKEMPIGILSPFLWVFIGPLDDPNSDLMIIFAAVAAIVVFILAAVSYYSAKYLMERFDGADSKSSKFV